MRRSWIYSGVGSFLVTLILLLTIFFPIFTKEHPVEAGFPSNFFGSRVAGASPASIENNYVAGIFTMNASTANPNNITAYVACTLSDKNMACAIYDAAEVKIATTTAKTITAGFTGWSTFTVNWTLNASVLRPSGVYNLTIWSTLGSGGGSVYYATSGGSGIKSIAGSDQWGWDNPVGFTSFVDSDGKLSIYCNYTVIGGGWVNRPPTISSPSPASSATGRLPLCALNFTVSDLDGNNTLVCIWNNKTGIWVKENQTNSFPANQTYRDLSASFATSYNTKYWWKITAYDGHDNVSIIYNFTTLTDTIAPQITLNFAGNHSDKGGPKYRPPSTSTLLSGANLDGYYTNDSYQKEPFIYINLTVYEVGSGMPTSNAIRLSWYNATTNTWDNSTYFTQKNTNYYEYNKTGIPKGKYSFNIYAVDKAGNVEHSFWNKTGPLGTVIRRYVNLNQTLETVTYRPLYLWNTTYTSISAADVLHHDQGTDGTVNDTGLLNFTVPGESMQDLRCTSNIGAYFDNSSCIQPFTLTNIYYHVWWSSQLDSPTRLSAMGWNKTRSTMINDFENSWSSINTTTRHSSVRWSHPYDTWGDFDENFSLETHLLMTTSISFTDNNIYEMMGLEVNTTGTSGKPMIIDNRSITTFIILNVPSNATLNASYIDSDSDGMHDWDELYRNYTNPFLSDTDNDGLSDYNEILYDSDPNNYTDTAEIPKAWYTIQTISGTLQNATSFKTLQTISGTLQNVTSFKTIQTITGTLQNITSFKTLQTISGVLRNDTSFKTLQTISGVLQNTTSFKTLQTISGVLQNTTSFKTIQTITGVLQNTTNWKTIQTINGILQNVSDTKWYTIQTITGTLQNTTSWYTTQSISGTLLNTTAFKTVQTITGVLQNVSSFKTIQTISGVLQNTTSFKTLQTISGLLQNTTSFKTIQTITGVLRNDTSFKTLQTISGILQNISTEYSTNLTVTGLSPTYNTTWSKNTTGLGSSNMRTFINNSSFPPINRNETMALHIAVNETSWVKNITFWACYLLDKVNGSIIDCDNITLLVSLDNTTWDILQHNAGSGRGRFPKNSGYLIWNQSTSPAGINPFTYTHGAFYINANTTVYARMMINITPTAHTGVYDNASGSDWQIQLHNNTLANPWAVWHYTTRLKLFNLTAGPATAWHTIQTISGILRNDTSFKTLQTISGVLQNTTSFKTLQTISGVLQNTTSFKTIQTISGVLQNTTSFKTLQTINGTLQNISDEEWTTIQTISGVMQNTTSFNTIQIITGTLQNTTSFKTIQTINGTLRNGSWWTIQTISGVIQNTSLVNITINSYQPLDNATGVCPCDPMCVEINATDNVNMTVYRKSHDEVAYYLVANYTNISAGERCFPIEGHIDAGMLIPIFFNETYDWYAYIEYYNDTTVNYTSPVYNFTTEDNPDLCEGGGGGFAAPSGAVFGILGLFGIFGIVGFIMAFRMRKRKKNRNE